MTIKKYQGNTKEEAIELAKKELGADAEIMNVEEKKSGGFLGLGKKVVFEITAMVDEEVGRFNAVADQDIKMSYDRSEEENELAKTKQQFAELSKIFRENENKGLRPAEAVKPEPTVNAAKPSPTVNTLKPEPAVNAVKSEPVADVVKPKPEADAVKIEPAVDMSGANHKFVRTLYNTLLDNDIDERYINQLLADMEKVLKNNKNVNYLISNVYQKMILKLGQPLTIEPAKKGPKVVFFIGSTGVGKTTTIAKLASKYKIELKKEVAFVTIDTYRLKATDQLGEYASIMKIPMSVILEPNELSDKVDKLSRYDLILVDTSGFSHKNNEMRDNVAELINNLDSKYQKEVYLVLSATTKYKDLKEIIDSYKEFTDFKMIFTKLDETTNLGNIYNCKLYSGNSLSYVTNGQNVPDDIEVLDTQKLVKQLLGGE